MSAVVITRESDTVTIQIQVSLSRSMLDTEDAIQQALSLDVYVMNADGGQPRRLTWHPGPSLFRRFFSLVFK